MKQIPLVCMLILGLALLGTNTVKADTASTAVDTHAQPALLLGDEDEEGVEDEDGGIEDMFEGILDSLFGEGFLDRLEQALGLDDDDEGEEDEDGDAGDENGDVF